MPARGFSAAARCAGNLHAEYACIVGCTGEDSGGARGPAAGAAAKKPAPGRKMGAVRAVEPGPQKAPRPKGAPCKRMRSFASQPGCFGVPCSSLRVPVQGFQMSDGAAQAAAWRRCRLPRLGGSCRRPPHPPPCRWPVLARHSASSRPLWPCNTCRGMCWMLTEPPSKPVQDVDWEPALGQPRPKGAPTVTLQASLAALVCPG